MLSIISFPLIFTSFIYTISLLLSYSKSVHVDGSGQLMKSKVSVKKSTPTGLYIETFPVFSSLIE